MSISRSPAGARLPCRLPAGRRLGSGRGGLLLAAGCLAGAVGVAGPVAGASAGPTSSTAAGPAAPATPFVFPVHDPDLLALDGEMRAFFAARVDRNADGETRLRQIVTAMLGADALDFTYDPDGDFSAAETFRRRRGNCVSFSLLAVAVARAYGLQAEFCEVNSYPHWDRHGNLITEIRHLNVRVRTGAATFALDLLPEPGRDAPVATSGVMPDVRAFAHFYNNLAVQRIAAGDAAGAQALFDRALAADPTAAFVWANKGAALVQTRDLAAAEPCLLRAVRLHPAEQSALSSLAGLYAQTGRPRQAAALAKQAEHYQLQNPYYLELLARRDYDRGQFRDANAHLRRAIAIKDDEPEFYELRLLVAEKLGWTADARRWDAKLQALRARLEHSPRR